MSESKEYKAQHFAKIFEKLNEDRKTVGKYCDVSIKSESSEFSAHKPIVSMFCEFMEKLFISEMKEKYTSVADITSISPKIMEEIMTYIYTEKITLTRENVFDVHMAADYMQITDLLGFCCDYFVEKLTLESCIPTLVYAQQHQAKNHLPTTSKLDTDNSEIEQPFKLQFFTSRKRNVKDVVLKTLDFISKNLSKVVLQERFFELTEENVKLILNKKHNCSEEVVYNSIVAWTKHDEENRKNHFDDLFALIDLSKLSATFLKTTVNDKDLVSGSLICKEFLISDLFKKLEHLENSPRRLTKIASWRSGIKATPQNNFSFDFSSATNFKLNLPGEKKK